ncbi:MAG: HIT domain-containing protein [Pseudomonadales bacterium]
MFALHPQLAKDCVVVIDLPLSQVLLLNDSHYPWTILVPRRENIREIFQLEVEDQRQLLTESSVVSAAMAAYFNADKMNVAALGNMVPQLHVHHIVRCQNDPAWPNPVWGAVAANPYSDKNLQARVQELRQLLANCEL